MTTPMTTTMETENDDDDDKDNMDKKDWKDMEEMRYSLQVQDKRLKKRLKEVAELEKNFNLLSSSNGKKGKAEKKNIEYNHSLLKEYKKELETERLRIGYILREPMCTNSKICELTK